MGGTLLAYINEASQPEYQHLDHLGSPVAATSSFCGLLWKEVYTPYGEKTVDPAGSKNLASFTGHIDDDLTGLTYMQARYYDPNGKARYRIVPAAKVVLNYVKEKGIGVGLEVEAGGKVAGYGGEFVGSVAGTIMGDHGVDAAGVVGFSMSQAQATSTQADPKFNPLNTGFGFSVDPMLVLGDASDLKGTAVETNLTAGAIDKLPSEVPNSLKAVMKILDKAKGGGIEIDVPLQDGGAYTLELSIGRYIGVDMGTDIQVKGGCSIGDGC